MLNCQRPDFSKSWTL